MRLSMRAFAISTLPRCTALGWRSANSEKLFGVAATK
jgi:hypothetical protein